MIYADHAATTQLDREAFEAMLPFLLKEYGNASQPYSFSRTAKRALEQAREIIAQCIGALPEEIYFTSGGTESNNWALKGSLSYEERCEIITSQIEHHSVLNVCKAAEKLRFNTRYLPVDTFGTVSAAALDKNISDKTKLVSVMMANNEVGTIEPIQELCSITHRHGVVFHTDAVQAIGHVPVDVACLNVDMLSASAHKFNGPKGIGFLYIRKGTPLRPYADGGSQEHGLRAGTENVAAIVGMAAALKKSCDTMQQRIGHLKYLEQQLLCRLREAHIDFIRNGTNQLPGNISLSFREAEGEMLLHRLDFMGICVSLGSACNSGNMQMSHVLEAMKVPKEYAIGTIRVSFGHTNTVEDADIIADAIVRILKDQ